MPNNKFLLIILFFPFLLVFLPVFLVYWKFQGKKQAKREKNRKKQEKKLLTHIYNFSPVRLKNRIWRNIIKKPKKNFKKRAKNHPN